MIRVCHYQGLTAGLLLVMAGCQHYARQPLDLERHASTWRGRNLEADPVMEYARRLATETNEDSRPFNSKDGLSCREAEAVALHFNPKLRLARARAEVPLVNAREAGWWPDPEFEVEVLRFANRGRKTRFRPNGPSIDGINAGGLESTPFGFRRVEGDFVDDPWIVGAGLSITIPLSGRLSVEEDWAWARYTAVWRRIVIAEWELLTSLRTQWLEWSSTQERIELTKRHLERLDRVSGIAGQLASAGELKPIEARLLRVEVARQRAALQSLRAKAEQQRIGLFSTMGVAPDAPVDLVPDICVPTVGHSPGERRDGVLRNHPRVQAARAEYETAEQELRLEIRTQYPDLTVGPSYSFEEGFSRLGFGFGFPVPLWNRNRQAIAEAFAKREAARIQAEVELEGALSALAQAEASLSAAQSRREVLEGEVAPLVDQQLQETQKLLDLGEIDVLVLRDALTTSLKTKLQVLDAALAEAVAADALNAIVQPRWVSRSQTKHEEESR